MLIANMDNTHSWKREKAEATFLWAISGQRLEDRVRVSKAVRNVGCGKGGCSPYVDSFPPEYFLRRNRVQALHGCGHYMRLYSILCVFVYNALKLAILS